MANVKATLTSVLSDLNKKFGDNTVMDLSCLEAPKLKKVSTGLSSLDLVIGGGIPEGQVTEIYGPSASGKSTLSIHLLRQFQKAYPEKMVALIDVENAYDPDYSEALGLDSKRLLLSQPNRAEDALSIVEKLSQTGEVSAIVVDSVAQLVPSANLSKEIDESANIATLARLLSQTMPRLVDAVAENGVSLIFINQIRMMIGVMYGNPETVPGGMALKYACHLRLEIRGHKPEERNGVEGIPVNVKVVKNKQAKPGMKTELFLAFGKGFDEVFDAVSTGVELKIIKQGGAWYEYGAIKAQGKESLMNELRANETLLAKLKKDISNFDPTGEIKDESPE